MSYYCEMCGRELDQKNAKKAIVEGSLLILCPNCYSRLSKQYVVKEPAPTAPYKASTKNLTRQQASSSKSSVKRVEEYEVVEDYATKVKTAREKYGWSQEVLAQKVGESINTIKRIEAGKLKPSIELARKLEKVLSVKLLEPVIEEPGATPPTRKDEFLTIGDIIDVRGHEKKKSKGVN